MSTDLAALAADLVDRLKGSFPGNDLRIQQVLCVAEESGEFVGAYRRWAGMARRQGTWDDVRAELADVTLAAFAAADVLGIDLDQEIKAKVAAIYARPQREDAKT